MKRYDSYSYRRGHNSRVRPNHGRRPHPQARRNPHARHNPQAKHSPVKRKRFGFPIHLNKSKKTLLLFLIPIFILIIVIIILLVNLFPKVIPDNEFAQGTNFELKEGKEATFVFDNGDHTIKVNSVGENSVSLTIQSNPIQVHLRIGEEEKFDLDHDGFFDIQIRLDSIREGVPDIYLKEIHENTCTEDWNCGRWKSCSEQGSQSRTCIDSNACGTEELKPAITQTCTYVESNVGVNDTCIESWECGNWTLCSQQGNQTRTCTDLNACNTTENKSLTNRTCTYVEANNVTCVEDWECNDWSLCVDEEKIRTCTDLNDCDTEEDKPNEQQSCALQILDCGDNTQSIGALGDQSNFDCFVESSENCGLSKLLNTVATDLLGILTDTTTHMELKGVEENKCIYYQRIESNSVELTGEIIQILLEGGSTVEEINQQEQEMSALAQRFVGLEQTCKFNNTVLTSMLNRWKYGNYSGGASCILNSNETFECVYTGDFKNAECVSSP